MAPWYTALEHNIARAAALLWFLAHFVSAIICFSLCAHRTSKDGWVFSLKKKQFVIMLFTEITYCSIRLAPSCPEN
jgi:thiamine transporter ThiT